MMYSRLVSLPAELVKQIGKDLDALSNIYVRATCKDLREAFEPFAAIESFSLNEDTNTYDLPSLNSFVDHIYDRVVSSDLDEKSYHMIRQPQTRIVFRRKRKRNRYDYSVNIEHLGERSIEVTYDSNCKRYRCRKLEFAPLDVPIVLYVCAIRYMRKIYKDRPVHYNFDEATSVPPIVRKMLSKNYDGKLIAEVVRGNFAIL